MKIRSRRGKQVVAEMLLKRTSCAEYEIAFVWVAPEQRGKGLASKLLERAMKRCETLVGYIDPDGSGLTHQQIKAWLHRRGFRHCWYDFYDNGAKRRAMLWTKGNAHT